MSGGFNPISMISQAALAVATGGTSLIAQVAMQIATQIASQVIQQVGQQLGLPQSFIDLAQGAMQAAAGNPAGAAQEFGEAAGGIGGMVSALGNHVGAGPAQVGEATRTIEDSANSVKNVASEQASTYLKGALEGKDEDGGQLSGKRAGRGSGGAGESFLMRLAVAMGRVIDGKMDDQLKLAKDIDGKKASKDESHVSEDSAKLQALAQEINLMSTALSTSMKTIGEALQGLARKQ